MNDFDDLVDNHDMDDNDQDEDDDIKHQQEDKFEFGDIDDSHRSPPTVFS